MSDWQVEVFNLAVDNVPGVQFWVHTCWGEYGGTPGYLPDETEQEYGAYVLASREAHARARPGPWHLPEGEGGAPDRAELGGRPHRPGRSQAAGREQLGQGLRGRGDRREVDHHRDRGRGLGQNRKCLEYVPAERLGLTTDCGLVMLQRMTAQNKLRALAEGAAIVRPTDRGAELNSAAPVQTENPRDRKAGMNGDPRRRRAAARFGGIGVPPAALAAGPGARLAERAGVPQPQPAGGL